MYLLDTNMISALMNQDELAWTRFRTTIPSTVFTCEIVMAELLYGIALLKDSRRKHALTGEFDDIASNIACKTWDRQTSKVFATIKSDLKRSGRLIEDFDVVIAAHAIRHELTLVTANTRDFARIKNLTLENWT